MNKLKNFIKRCLRKGKRVFSLVFYILPINKKKITFCNFQGKGYGCNPKYLAEEFLKENKYKLIWFVSDMSVQMPNGIKKVKYGSLKHYYHLITAKLWIDNIRNNLKPIFKRKKQIYVQTWHGGIAVKGIEKDVEQYLDDGYIKDAKKDGLWSDYIISGSEYQSEMIKRAFWFNGEILKLGIPRDDSLFNYDQNEINKIKESFGLIDKKIVLYAPSFRVDKDFYKNLKFDANKLIEAFNKHFEGDHVLCVRLHPNDATEENIAIFENAVNFNKLPDSNIALLCSDYVISDYSSILFDFARIGRVSIVYAPDYENYIKNERLLYFSLKDSFFPFSSSFDDLVQNIMKFDKNKYDEQIKEFNNKFGFYDNKNSSKRVKEYLQKIIGF